MSSSGESRVETATNAPDPRVDCFYVYPTVSDQQGPNSDRRIEPQQTAIAQYQAARFSETCRVFAPVYRQRTVPAIFGPPGNEERAFQWPTPTCSAPGASTWPADNRGRGVVLIGHSQGTRMLRRLIREEIDPSPAARAKLVSAVLLGGNVTVRRGEVIGGDFQNVPGCTAPGQVGCVIAYHTFNQTPAAQLTLRPLPAGGGRATARPRGPLHQPCRAGRRRGAPRHADQYQAVPRLRGCGHARAVRRNAAERRPRPGCSPRTTTPGAACARTGRTC